VRPALMATIACFMCHASCAAQDDIENGSVEAVCRTHHLLATQAPRLHQYSAIGHGGRTGRCAGARGPAKPALFSLAHVVVEEGRKPRHGTVLIVGTQSLPCAYRHVLRPVLQDGLPAPVSVYCSKGSLEPRLRLRLLKRAQHCCVSCHHHLAPQVEAASAGVEPLIKAPAGLWRQGGADGA
jgi:hypothetical protein